MDAGLLNHRRVMAKRETLSIFSDRTCFVSLLLFLLSTPDQINFDDGGMGKF
jgi:hypothetical protein